MEYSLIRPNWLRLFTILLTIAAIVPVEIFFEFLKSHLWSAADILMGSLDSSDYRQPIMTLLFLKRLNDTFEENAENLITKGINEIDGSNQSRYDNYNDIRKPDKS
jgi:type I restriction-modification system DNA methylase subunit